MEPILPKGLDSDAPTDTQHPLMYERAVYLLGSVALLCVVTAGVLIGLGHEVDAGLVAIGASAVGGLVSLLAPRK